MKAGLKLRFRALSMLEAIVSAVVTALLMAGALVLVSSIVNVAATEERSLEPSANAAFAEALFVADVGNAGPCDIAGLAYPLESYGPAEFTVFTDADADGLLDRVRWHLSGDQIIRDVYTATDPCVFDLSAPSESTAPVRELPAGTVSAFNFYNDGVLLASTPLTSCSLGNPQCVVDYVRMDTAASAGSTLGADQFGANRADLRSFENPGRVGQPTVSDASGSGNLNVSWEPPLLVDGVTVIHGSELIDRWVVSYDYDPTFTSETIVEVLGFENQSTVLTGLADAVPVYVRVTAISNVGPGEYSLVSSGTSIGFPGPPSSMTAAFSPGSLTNLQYTVSAPTALGGGTLQGYEASYTDDAGDWSSYTQLGLANSGSLSLAAQPTVDFQVRIRAVNEEGPGAPTYETVTVSQAPNSVGLLLVAGGGGGGQAAWWGGGGGGGAGGMIEASNVGISAGLSYTVTVGEGGEGGPNWGSDGEDSVFGSYTSIGGGRGARGGSGPTSPATGGTGGSGGGSSSGGSYASGVSGQGNRGGVGDNAGNYTGGGGGGAGGVGQNAPNTSDGGAGGPGKSNSLTGSPATYASGGDGGDGWGGSAGANGAANSGDGGGGGSATLSGWLVGGDGGSGVVIIRFDGAASLPTISGGLTYTTSSVGGDTVIKFTAGTGTISW